jgi:hypothetical protein
MPSRSVMLFRLTALSAALALAACGQDGNANSQALAANDADPALTSALADQVLTDPELAQQANRLNVRPAEAPIRAEYPAGGTPVVRRASATTGPDGTPGSAAGGCGVGAEFAYGMEWAQRLPPYFPPYPGGRVTEAAGQDRGECRVRVVTFRTADPAQRVLDWYQRRAVDAGFSAEQQARGGDQVLGGVNQTTNGAYYLIVTPKEGGSEVALIVNNGR